MAKWDTQRKRELGLRQGMSNSLFALFYRFKSYLFHKHFLGKDSISEKQTDHLVYLENIEADRIRSCQVVRVVQGNRLQPCKTGSSNLPPGSNSQR